MSIVGLKKLHTSEVRDFLLDSITKLRCIDCMDRIVISELSRDDSYDVYVWMWT